MQVIIPVAGKGTRLKPHTNTKAKPLISVAGKPVLAHILDGIKNKKSISEVIFITGHLGSQIEQYVKKNYSFKVRFIEQAELNGQASAVKLAEKFIKEDVIIWFVDTISDADIDKLTGIKEDGAIYVKQVADPRRFGQVQADSSNVVLKIAEKADPPISNLVNIGLYYVKNYRLMFSCINELMQKKRMTKGEYFLMDAFQMMIEKGAKFRSLQVKVWEDCGTPEALLQTNRYFLQLNNNRAPKTVNSIIIPPVYIEKNAKIENSIIGPFVSIASNATVRNSIIKDSIINENAYIENSLLNNSLIGDNSLFKGQFKKLNIGDSSELEEV